MNYTKGESKESYNNFTYCDKHDYSGLDRCTKQCEVCKELSESQVPLAKVLGKLKNTKNNGR